MAFEAVDAEERRRREECAREPIRTPGAVQSHGVMVVADAETFTIRAVSANSEELLGRTAEALLGTSATALVGEQGREDALAIIGEDRTTNNPLRVTLDGEDFDVIVSGNRENLVLEFEPVLPDEYQPSFSVLYEIVGRMAKAATVDELRDELVSELCHLTGFDRVMIYHFHPDGHGEVVAEAHHEEMEPYLGLHFPASDIPAQARDLYVTKLSRTIASSEEPPAALVAAADLDVKALDLSSAELRAVSPFHLQFMRNMGQLSTLSLSLVRDDQLIGMITCAHRTYRRLPYAMRRGLEMLAHQAALQIAAMDEIVRLKRDVRVREIRSELVSRLFDADDISGALFDGDRTVLDLIPSDGVVVRLAGAVTTHGMVPDADVLPRVIETMLGGKRGVSVVTNSVAEDYPQLRDDLGQIAGVLIVPLGGVGDYLAFFRGEVTRSVRWLGDLGIQNRPNPLSPRLSFSAWTQSVTETSVPWLSLRDEAAELARDLESALLRHAESLLANLALHDPLTGLPNRRLLMDRLEVSVARSARGSGLALLFIDLDAFKSINDTYGHDIGDAVIVEVGQRLVRGARASDTVARLGGDEFVVLCDDVDEDAINAVAGRILAEVSKPLDVRGREIRVTVSVGVALGVEGIEPQELVRRADAAMYRAKDNGRNQSSL